MTDITIAFLGQSNGVQMCTVPVGGVNPAAGTFVWNPNTNWRAMTSGDGAGMIELANMIHAQTGANIYVYNCCYGGSSLIPQATDPSQPHNCWQVQAQDSPLNGCMTQIAVGGRVPQFVIWMQGEQDALYSSINPSFDIVGNYTVCLDQLRRFLLQTWGVGDSQCLWLVTPVGHISYGNTKYVLQAQQLYSNDTNGVSFGSARYDMTLVDGVHMTGTACQIMGDRFARDILNKMGVGGFENCNAGPQITSAWKGGRTIAMSTNSKTGVVANPGTSFLSGFQVYDFPYANLLTITGAYVSNQLIFLYLQDNPGDGNKVHVLYQADNLQSVAFPVFDQQQPFLNWGSPLLPCYEMETMN